MATASDVYKRIDITKEMRDHYERLAIMAAWHALPGIANTFMDLVEAWDKEMYE